jgi:SAM-dependent methyltransferase
MATPGSRVSLQAIFQLVSLADYTVAFAFRAVSSLDVADHLTDEPRSVEQLASSTNVHVPSLLRAMRALVSRGIFSEPAPGQFALNHAAHWLRRDHPQSLREAFCLIGPEVEAWAALDYSISTGRSSFERVHRTDYWDYVASRQQVFAQVQASDRPLTALELESSLRAFPWSDAQTVADVGALDGTFLSRLLAHYRGLDGVRVGRGETLPEGMDMYVLRHVLCTRDDAAAAELLAAVRQAMQPGGRLLLIEPAWGAEDLFSISMDLLMLVRHGGRLRTTDELIDLLSSSAFTCTRVVHDPLFRLVEALPALRNARASSRLTPANVDLPSLPANLATAAFLSLGQVADYTVPFLIRAISTLGVADHLGNQPRSIDDLAAATRSDPSTLRRVLRALSVHGVFQPVGPDAFALNPAADLLRTDHALSLRDAYMLSPIDAAGWGNLDYCLRTGKAAFDARFGQRHRDYRAEHPEEDARMDRAQAAATRIDILTIIRLYEWLEVKTVVDVGGGTGAFLAGLLSRYKAMRGVLFDLPRMVANSRGLLEAAGVAERCDIVGGDFFVSVPAGADVYVLKAVVGGWDDEAVGRILRTVRSAMRQDSRLLVIEPILQYGDDFTQGNIVHLHSLVLYGGPDRTRDDYDRLFAAVELRISRVIRRPTLPLIEVVPA